MAQPFRIKTPLPEGELLLRSFEWTEGLGRQSQMHVVLLSRQAAIDPNALLGKPMTVIIEQRDGSKRFLNGYTTRFTQSGTEAGSSERHHVYTAVLSPWLWFLTRTHDCRILPQEQKVADIVKTVFADHPIALYDFKLFRDYRPWVYCVQYRESDYNFVARMLEHEGIYYRYEHDENQHRLMLVDSSSAHDPQPGGADTLRFFPGQEAMPPNVDGITEWSMTRHVQPGAFVLDDYDFTKPSTDLKVSNQQSRSYSLSDYEVYDYPGAYMQKADGTHYIDNRRDERQAAFETYVGKTNALALRIGHTFKLQKHPRADQNREYLVTGTTMKGSAGSHEAGDAAGAKFECEFTAIPSDQQFRPPRITDKPSVAGPQTAIVVGSAGAEIETDKYGRVKVQFHWDRLGKRNEKSSCWIRVAQVWAGKNFGAIFTPRIGQEVIVDFLEGDPDQPIITGRVYNAEQMPPWDLPANATQSGFLTRSSKGGAVANANAIRFEDKKGSEQLWIHAEKNQDIEVENDETHWVGHDRTKTIDHDETVHVKHNRTETVDNNETITIGANRVESVGRNETIAIGVNRTESVGANESITIGANRTISVGASETATVALQRTHAVGINESIAIGAAQEVAVGAAQTITVGANQSTTVGANQSTSVGANQSNTIGSNQTTQVGADRSITVGGDQSTKVGKGRATEVAQDDLLKVGKNFVVEAADSIAFKTGSATITMKKDGTITIKGKDITIEGSGKINVKASSDVIVKGSKIQQN